MFPANTSHNNPLLSSNSPSDQPKDQNKTPVTKRKKKIWLIPICVVICAIAVFAVIQIVHLSKYNYAISLMDSGDFLLAKTEFVNLGAYKDSGNLAENCQHSYDLQAATLLMKAGNYNAAKLIFESLGDFGQSGEKAIECQNSMDYNAALALKDNHQLQEAKDAFLLLGGFSDSAAMAKECQNQLDYNAALALMDSDKIQEARDAFLVLGSYSDSAAKAAECKDRLSYDKARQLMDSGNLLGAITFFTTLGDYKDSTEMAQQCRLQIDYNEAEAVYSQGKYYTAYTLFNKLSGFKDAAGRAEACKQAMPKSGELYRNPKYSARTCSLYIKAPADGYYTCVKIKIGGELASIIFIAPGTKVKVKLPSCSCEVSEAYGHDWFGTEETFGPSGMYSRLIFGDSSEYSLDRGYYYVFTLRTSEGNIQGKSLDYTQF